MHRDALLDELRRVAQDVEEGERALAQQEALLATLRPQSEDLSKAEAVLNMMREHQRLREDDRQRLLTLLQP